MYINIYIYYKILNAAEIYRQQCTAMREWTAPKSFNVDRTQRVRASGNQVLLNNWRSNFDESQSQHNQPITKYLLDVHYTDAVLMIILRFSGKEHGFT